MTPERAEALYRRLRRLFPATWRAEQEADFVDTLRESAAAGDGPGIATQTMDLLALAAVLRRRELGDRLARRRVRPASRGRALPPWLDRVVGLGPSAAVLAFALVLLAPVLRWGGEISVEFVVTTLLVVAVPGIGVLYTISCALAGGRGRGLVAAIGCTLGIVPHLVLAFLGLSGLMQLGATLFEAVRWAGVAYLAWMGVTMLRSGGTSRGDEGDRCDEGGERSGTHAGAIDVSPSTEVGFDVQGPGGVILRGVLLNVLNPKLTLFFFAFLPQFLAAVPGEDAAVIDPRLFGLGSLFMLLTLGGFVLYALAGAAAREWVVRAPRALAVARRSIGVLLLGFAARLALSER